jgi:hypothetical protein
MMSPIRRCLNLLHFFGLPRRYGSLDQIVERTGIGIDDLLCGHPVNTETDSSFHRGQQAQHVECPATRAKVVMENTHLRDFWLGIACSQGGGVIKV